MSSHASNASHTTDARIVDISLAVLGTGGSLPGPALSSEALIERMRSGFGIQKTRLARSLSQRLGVNSRHVCRDFVSRRESPRPGHRNPELASNALRQALERAGLRANDLGYLLTHTATPARPLPTNASEVAAMIGYRGAYAEFRQACTGFASALQFAAALLAQPNAAPVAIVGSETGSVFFDPLSLQQDHQQWVNFLQMGDGAGAVILAPARNTGLTLRSPFIGQDAPESAGLQQRCGGSDHPWTEAHTLSFEHDYQRVMQSGPALLEAGRTALESRGYNIATAAKVVTHQANGRMSEWLQRTWRLRPNQCFGNGERVGNLGSASIWVALDALLRSGGLSPGAQAWFLGAEATQHTFGGFLLDHVVQKPYAR